MSFSTPSFAAALFLVLGAAVPAQAQSAAPADTRAIAKEAYLYGFPMVESYKTLYEQAVEKGGPEFRAPFNEIGSVARVATPDDKSIITPNSDTPYSFLWMDLRAEPLVLTLPKIEKERYFSVQLIDLYTQNYDYLGSRTTGNDGGVFMVAGPNWKGPDPAGVKKVLRCETEIAYAVYRTQLFAPDDLENVKKAQAGYQVQTLSAFTKGAAPKAAPAIAWPKYDAAKAKGVEFFGYLGFLLQFCPIDPSEKELRARLATIGIAGGQPFDPAKLTPEMKQALEGGIADGVKEFETFKKAKVDTRQVTSGDLFGNRAFLKNNYLYRYTAARLGIFGNSREEAIYPGYFVDAAGKPLDASKTAYRLHFAKDQFPPAEAFWSMTMYDGKTQLLVANPLHRYLLNSPMLKDMKRDADGGLTLWLQKDSPGKEREANWLPAPDGPFYAVLRIYRPKQEAIDGRWKEPLLEPVTSG